MVHFRFEGELCHDLLAQLLDMDIVQQGQAFAAPTDQVMMASVVDPLVRRFDAAHIGLRYDAHCFKYAKRPVDRGHVYIRIGALHTVQNFRSGHMTVCMADRRENHQALGRWPVP